MHNFGKFQSEERQVCNWHCKNEHMKFQISYQKLTKYNQTINNIIYSNNCYNGNIIKFKGDPWPYGKSFFQGKIYVTNKNKMLKEILFNCESS